MRTSDESMARKKAYLISISIAFFLISCLLFQNQRPKIDPGQEIFRLNDHSTHDEILWSPDSTEIGFTNFDPGIGFSKVMIFDIQTRGVSEPLKKFGEILASTNRYPMEKSYSNRKM